MSFVHLHCRSYFSLKDGAYSPEDLALGAAERGMPAVALTDRDGLYGAVRFTDACHRVGVQPILGARLTLGDGGPAGVRPSVDPRVLLLARDAVGYGNLCRLITEAHMSGERGEPSLSPRAVMARAEGLVCLLGPESPPGAMALGGRPGAARELLRPWREAFGRWCFVEVRHLMEPGSTAEIRTLLRLAEDAGLPGVATNPVRHLAPEDAFLADALECMRQIVPVDDHHLSRRNTEGHLKSANEMRALFADRPDLCDATVRIAEACTFDLGLGRVHFPDFPTPRGRSATSVLAERCHAGVTWRGLPRSPEVIDRVDLELGQIHRMGYAAYFLTVADIVAEVKRMGIRCGARGSAAGSLVCYLTGISEVDPVHHGLLFERFINPLRDELPDIDVDVESARREEVYEMILRRHGWDRCACVTMVDTYRARAAVREVGKALGYPEDEIDRVAKAFPHIGAHRIREAMESLPELRGSNLGAGQLETLFRVAERLNGFPRHLALHPSGIVLSGDDLPDRVPVERSFLEHRMVQADKDDVERLGLLKLDVLGVRLLSSMRHSLDEIQRTTGERIDLDRIPHDDEDTFELIRASNTIGCFQIESPGQRELLQKLQPERFEDLIVDISLFRPGPVKSDMITPFINRRFGWERPRYAHPALRAALQETYGVIVYHEQIMRVLEVAGYDLAQADRIRRHLDDGAEIGELENAFLEHAVACGLGSDDADTVWRELASFASFGFCKAHAAAFAVPTYQSSWLKAHYPAHFLAGVLTHEPGMYPRRLILEDAREHAIPILPLDVNHSQKPYTVEPAPNERLGPSPRRGCFAEGGRPSSSATYGIRIGLQDVHGISDAEIASILGARAERPFASVGDFLRRTRVSRPVVEALAHAGAFDAVGLHRDAPEAAPRRRAGRTGPPRVVSERGGRPSAGAAAEAGGASRGERRPTRRDRLYVAMTAETQREGEQLCLPLDVVERAPGLREYTDPERVRAELEVTGMDWSRHLLSFYEALLGDLGVIRSGDLRRCRGDSRVMVAGVKVASQTPAVRSGQRIIFLTLDDATGPVDITVFQRVQERCARTVFHGFLLAVWGRLRRTGVGGVSIAAEEVWDLQLLDAARREGRLLEMMRTPAGSPGASFQTSPDQAVPKKVWHSSGGSSGW
ncbi:MAG TPA: DNA polymerase III subunit alpha [Actinomycetota bacterium]|nr:DNA polymerase III subunit alpha [Actinomycetota bacterium]